MKYTVFEERLHAISHFVAFLLSFAGSIFLVYSAIPNFEKLIVACLYSLSLILTFGSSSVYHYVSNLNLKQKLLTADHISIYLLIAGTYTPIIYFGVHTYIFPILLGIWILTFLAIHLRYKFGENLWIMYPLYLLLGYNGFFYLHLLSQIAFDSVVWIIAGGTLYTIGLFFYKFKIVKYNHFIWHLLVMIAAICHYIGIYRLLV